MERVQEILNERSQTHGDYAEQATLAQDLKTPIRAYLSTQLPGKMSDAHLETIEMICVKISRAVVGDSNFPEHYEDIAGYATKGAEQCITQLPSKSETKTRYEAFAFSPVQLDGQD